MGTEIANYEEMLAKMAKKATEVERPTGSSIGVRAGMLQYNGNPVPGNKLSVVVIASTHTNLYYEDKFNPNDIKSPVCFAYGADGENMVPHPASQKPQSATCDTCPMNEWGSDPDGGRGKACKNSRSLALIPNTNQPMDAMNSEVAILKLPVMSVKNWQMYVQKCAALYNRPPVGMITEVGVVPDAKSQFRITFADVGVVQNDVLGALFPRIDAAQATLEHPYAPNPEPSPEQAAKAGRGKKY